MKHLCERDESNIYLSNISEKDKAWDSHKVSSRTVATNYQKIDYDAYSKRIWECGQSLFFALQSNAEDTKRLKLRSARFCRVRWCPICQWRRSLMWRGRFLKHIPRILVDYPTARFVFLTLTVKNCPIEDLKQTLKLMNTAWDKLVKRKEFPAIGFVRSLEVTKGKDGSAHPHFHCLLMVTPNYFSRNYINQERWAELWQQSLRVDYRPIVNVKSIKNIKSNNSGNVTELNNQLIKAICETLKYSVKESDLESEAQWLGELTNQMHKSRGISLGGIFKKYITESDPEDLIHSEDEEQEIEVTDTEAMLIFDWRELVKKYALRQ